MAVTAALSPNSLPQSSTGRLEVELAREIQTLQESLCLTGKRMQATVDVLEKSPAIVQQVN